MNTLEPPDTHWLVSAIGWLELGNTREAEAELKHLSLPLADHPDVLEVRWAIAATEHNWSSALAVAQKLVEIVPSRASGWLHRAYALRRVPSGGLNAAWDALLPAAQQFPSEVTIPYNLACYACQLGQLEHAREWLARAHTVGQVAALKKMALADDDLKPLWSEISAY